MKTSIQKFSILVTIVMLISQAIAAKERPKHGFSSPAVFTLFRLTAKQFSKGYHAERRDHQNLQTKSIKKMNRRLKGPWLKRWFKKTF